MSENSNPTWVYVGSYSTADGSTPGAVRCCELAPDGTLSLRSTAAAQFEAGFLCADPTGRYLYGVDERKSDGRGPVGPPVGVHTFRIDPSDGSLTHLGQRPAIGAFPTYASIDPRGEFLVTASHGSFDHVEQIVEMDGRYAVRMLYDDPTVCLYPVAPDGSLKPASDVHVLRGHGPDPAPSSPQGGGHPQASAHAHAALFHPGGELVVVCDKGADQIHAYRLNRHDQRLEPAHTWTAAPGTGPRHPAFHPNGRLLFVTNELNSSVSTFRLDPAGGALRELAQVATNARPLTRENDPADIVVDGRGQLVFVNNRGEDSVVSLRVDPDSGRLAQLSATSLAYSEHGGVAARTLRLDRSGRWLLVADRPANQVVVFDIDPNSGRFERVGELDIPEPAALALVAR